MKKISFLAIVLFLALGLAGCGKEEKNNQNNVGNEGTVNQKMGKGTSKEDTNGGEISMVDKLKNAVTSGKKMKCTYKMNDENGSTEVVTYMQGDKYKTEIILGEMKTVSIFDGDAMYSWVVGQKVGTKMTMDCIDSLDTKGEVTAENEPASDSNNEDKDNFMETLTDAQNLSCEDADDVDFSIPSGINFADQCEMLKSQQKMIEGFNK